MKMKDMVENKKIVAFDLGSSKITAMAAEVLEGGSVVRIISAEESRKSELIRNGIVEQMSGAAFEINDLIRKLQNSSKLPIIDQVYVSINAKSMRHFNTSVTRTFRRHTEITTALMEEMEAECRDKFQQPDIAVYDLIPISYELDEREFEDPVGQKGFEIIAKYNVIVGNKKILENLERCFDRTGIKLNEYNPLAMEAIAEAVLSPEDCEDGCALINLGATTTTLSIYANGALQHLLVVPLGSHNITRDIQELGVTEKVAERLKAKGEAMEKLVLSPAKIRVPAAVEGEEDIFISTKFLATIIEARLDETLQPVFNAITAFPQALGAGIVITGGGSKLNNILSFIEDRTVMNVRFGDHSGRLSDDTDECFMDPAYSQLVGIFLLIDEYNKEHPEEIVKEEPKKEPKIKRGIKEKVTSVFIDFFKDDNKMN